MKDKQQVESNGTTHQRSPNYPATSLPDAVEAAKAVFAKEKRTVLNQESLARAMGYGGLNGPSRTKIASLRKYGLVDDVGSGVQISQLAVRIIHQPETSADYSSAVREAALKPELIRTYLETHRDASEDTLRSDLIVKKGFSPDGAKVFARVFRETIAFAKLDDQDYSPKTDENKSGDTKDALPATPPVQPRIPQNPAPKMVAAIQPGELPVPIAEGLVARVPFPMSEDDFELLIGTLQLWKKKLIRRSEPITPNVKLPASATWKNNDSDKSVKIVAVMGEKDGETYYQSDDGTGIPSSQLTFD